MDFHVSIPISIVIAFLTTAVIVWEAVKKHRKKGYSLEFKRSKKFVVNVAHRKLNEILKSDYKSIGLNKFKRPYESILINGKFDLVTSPMIITLSEGSTPENSVIHLELLNNLQCFDHQGSIDDVETEILSLISNAS